MKRSALIPMSCLAALLGTQQLGHAAELIYGFNDATLNGFTGNPATGINKETVALSTTTGVTEGTGAIQINNTAATTYGGAVTSNVPADLAAASSFNVTVTITTTPVDGTGAPVYFDIVPIYYSNDGEIDPDLSKGDDYINIGAVAPGTYTYTVNNSEFADPDNAGQYGTPAQIIANDAAVDAANSLPPNAITGFQFTVEHGSGTGTTVYLDNVTVPVPEPVSLSGLALGGLLLGRRRR